MSKTNRILYYNDLQRAIEHSQFLISSNNAGNYIKISSPDLSKRTYLFREIYDNDEFGNVIFYNIDPRYYYDIRYLGATYNNKILKPSKNLVKNRALNLFFLIHNDQKSHKELQLLTEFDWGYFSLKIDELLNA